MPVRHNNQLAINMLASFVNFTVTTIINFFLSPYIVSLLGVDSYGFIGLSNQIIGYSGLITISLNAMAGRFIALSYQRGNIETAKKYFSSVFYANIFLATIIAFAFAICCYFLEDLIVIPKHIIFDVKLLFCFLAVSNICSILSGTFGVSLYIKNRLDLGSIRSIVSQVLRSVVLLVSFGLFAPHVWYIGVSGGVCALYILITNIRLSHRMTPDLILYKKYFDWIKVKELLASGSWNLLIKVGEFLGMGLDMVMANVFLGATAMGIFSITKAMPQMIKSLFQSFSSVYGPSLQIAYSKGNVDELVAEFKKSIRTLTFISIIPITILYVLGEEFYALWMPTQNAHWLYILTLCGTISFIPSLPVEGLWNMFTLANKVRLASFAVIVNNGLTFIVVILSMFLVDSVEGRLMILAGTRTTFACLLALTFTPIASALLLGKKWYIFYPEQIRAVVSILLTCFIGLLIKSSFIIDSWISLIVSAGVLSIFCFFVTSLFVLKKSDLQFIFIKFFHINL